MLAALGFTGLTGVLFVTGNASTVDVIFSTIISNIGSAYEKLITLSIADLFDQWIDGVLSLILMAAFAAPLLLIPTKK